MKKCCSIEGCNKPHKAKGLCAQHYNHELYKKKTGKENTREKHNRYKIVDNVAYLELVDCKDKTVAITKIDLDDLDKVIQSRWRLNHNKHYVVGNKSKNSKKHIYLHRFIMNVDDNLEIDHIDGNGLNNCKQNLRICTSQQNKFNKRFRNDNNTVGVTYCTNINKWRARISLNQKSNNLIDKSKFFSSKEEALKQRIAWEKKYFKEFSIHNTNGSKI